ncbi:hypothetical protein D3C84_1200800 [compost metagenome]
MYIPGSGDHMSHAPSKKWRIMVNLEWEHEFRVVFATEMRAHVQLVFDQNVHTVADAFLHPFVESRLLTH